jgi:hypothetical protein
LSAYAGWILSQHRLLQLQKKKKEEKKKERVRHPFTPKDCVDVMQWPQKAIP